MDRHRITDTLRRLAEIREQQARTDASLAKRDLEQVRMERDALIRDRVENEARVRESGSISCADLQLLELSREQYHQRLSVADSEVDQHRVRAESADDAHRHALGRFRTATKVNERVHREWLDEVQRKRTQQLEELSRSHWMAQASC